ncbi:hypothetical protein M434DRAFT_191089 [Hypoxylon sp. CO27-5]|nr:hypothetical protein M434DRAFT_191089 [Hypoxylon sp. CO27-5]
MTKILSKVYELLIVYIWEHWASHGSKPQERPNPTLIHAMQVNFEDCGCSKGDSRGTKWAILIGIDYYIPGNNRPGMSFPMLNGCVNDVMLVENHLRCTTDIDPHRIHKLTASRPPAQESESRSLVGRREMQPTYENMVKVFEHVTKRAKKGDLVYVHFAGHGASVASIFASLKTRGGELDKKKTSKADSNGVLDEVLVPTDIACGGRYLRDVELAVLLQDMAERGLAVTIVLDCCHGGGMNRGNQGVLRQSIRGIQNVDTNILESDVSIISDHINEQYQKLQFGETDRAGAVRKHWLLGFVWKSCVFFAACKEDEFAGEQPFNGKTQGIFTYHWIETLNRWTDITYDGLDSFLRPRLFQAGQNIVSGGETDRVFFRMNRIPPFNGAIISKTPSEGIRLCIGSQMTLSAGQAHGVSNGDMFDIWPWWSQQPSQSTRLGRVSVQEATEHMSTVKLTCEPKGAIEVGCLAVPVPARRLKIVSSTAAKGRVDEIRRVLETHEGASFTFEDEGPSDFLVRISDSGYEIQYGDGQHLENEIPALHSPQDIGYILEHVSKYQNVLRLGSQNVGLPSNVSVRLCQPNGKLPPEAGRPNFKDQSILQDVSAGPDGIFEVKEGNWTVLRIGNMTQGALNIVVLELEASWAVSQLYPSRENTTFETLGPGGIIDIPIQWEIPEYYPPTTKEVVDILKVCFTSHPTSFRWLEIEELHQGPG